MSKYMCIEVPSHWPRHAAMYGVTHPEVGEIVTSSGEIKCTCGCGEVMIIVVEHHNWEFSLKAFAPLSDIDETELVNEREVVV